MRYVAPLPESAAAVGLGPSLAALTVQGRRVTVHDGPSVTLGAGEAPEHVQPLPGGRFLLVRSRGRRGGNAEIWTADGRLERRGSLGHAVLHVLTTPSGSIWVGYYDEAIGEETGPVGLARFDDDLTLRWQYTGDVLKVLDCYALNVIGEDAWICAYSGFHLLSVRGDQVSDHGPTPRGGAAGLLVSGGTIAQVSGYVATGEQDLVTLARRTDAGLTAFGEPHRLVRPDGSPLERFRLACRGPELHVFHGTDWYRTDLGEILAA